MKHWPIVLLTMALAGCGSKKQVLDPAPDTATGAADIPHVLVYRTKGDYRELVPVMLSADRSKIVSYPHPSDLKGADGLSLPQDLGKGYLLDKRGIGLSTALLKMRYADYAKLDQAPALADLTAMIVDKDPLLELCDCGPRAGFKDIAAEITTMVAEGVLEKRCKKLK
ncbi:MAG: hypothetical protein IPK99_05330 [Flavobacteriales bacterium]|nr:hypothetical protein [Flavobacteriales bacterium]